MVFTSRSAPLLKNNSKGIGMKSNIAFWKPGVVGIALLFVAVTNKDFGHACALGAIAVYELIHFSTNLHKLATT
jgi:hypothetical protein